MKTKATQTLAVTAVTVSCVFHFGCGATMPGAPTAQVTTTGTPNIADAQAEPYDGPRARIAVGDFQVNAGSGAPHVIGDGLREMMVTALFGVDRFIVLERQAMQDVLLEQDLGASARAVQKTGAPIGRIEGAELLVYGVVSEFKMDSSGTGLGFAVPGVPLQLGGGVRNAHLGLDLRVVDSTTGRIVLASRVEGKASDYATQVGSRLGNVPVALGSYKNTPMEKAIRVCIDAAVRDLVAKTPKTYFHN